MNTGKAQEKPPPTETGTLPTPEAGNSTATVQDTANKDARLERYQQARQLHEQGYSQRDIAARLQMDRSTVRRYVCVDAYPERACARRSSRVDQFHEYLHHRWQEGCHNAAQLFAEIKDRGFDGSYYMVRRRLASWRNLVPGADRVRAPPLPKRCSLEKPSSRRVSWWLLQEPADLDEEERILVGILREENSEIDKATELAREFRNMVCNRQASAWEPWLTDVETPGVAAEIKSFAEGLKRDEAAVRAALESEWSNGQVEGQINRLKMIKRQMYGRANFDLLRLRFLYRG